MLAWRHYLTIFIWKHSHVIMPASALALHCTQQEGLRGQTLRGLCSAPGGLHPWSHFRRLLFLHDSYCILDLCLITCRPTPSNALQAAEFSGRVTLDQEEDADIKRAGYCVSSSKVTHIADYFDLSGCTHLVLDIKGDGRTYIANVRTDSIAGTGGDVWQAPFKTRWGASGMHGQKGLQWTAQHAQTAEY